MWAQMPRTICIAFAIVTESGPYSVVSFVLEIFLFFLSLSHSFLLNANSIVETMKLVYSPFLLLFFFFLILSFFLIFPSLSIFAECQFNCGDNEVGEPLLRRRSLSRKCNSFRKNFRETSAGALFFFFILIFFFSQKL